MSHNPEAVIDCPNCGYKAQYNYCARCGQATHLHKDTFWGLIVHFVAHYFHYDSKFWKTLKTLWLKPGALTIAYREKKRMRYIDPISLYIFISAVFFLFFFSFADGMIKITEDAGDRKITNELKQTDRQNKNIEVSGNEVEPYETEFDKRISSGVKKSTANREAVKETFDTLLHNIPKVVFFMIPILAIVLKLLFIRRRGAYFVDHGIFSLHYHSFWFSLMLLQVINPFSAISGLLSSISIIISMLYFVVALKKAYSITVVRSIFYSLIIGSLYCVFFLVVGLAGVGYMLYLKG